MQKSIEIFFCYAREDEDLRQGLEKQLRSLRRQGIIDVWHDRKIGAGAEWEREIDQHLNAAQIILLLVSPDFMDSDYCYSVEMKRAMERHERGEARVIPVILRYVYWQKAPFGKLQALPTDAIPVVSPKWHSQDEAFFTVAEGIRITVENILKEKEVQHLQEQGGLLLEQKRYNEALTTFTKAILLAENSTNALINRGEAYRLLKQYNDAFDDFNRALTLEPDNAFALCRRGETYRMLSRYDEALVDFNHSLALESDNAFAFARRGETYRLLKQYNDAFADFDHSLALESDNAFAFARRGEAYRLLKQYNDAFDDFNRALTLEPDNVFALCRRGETYRMLSRYDEALVDLNRALTLEPDNAFALRGRNLILGQK